MNKINNKIKIFLVLFCIFGMFGFVSAAVPVNYELLEPLPYVEKEVSSFGFYLANMFKLAISLAAVLAVFQIALGGFKYMTVETFVGKTDAKEKITKALIGLVLVLASYLILFTINPDLVNTDLIIPSVSTTAPIEKPDGTVVDPSVGSGDISDSRPLGNLVENGYTKTKVSSWTDKYEKGGDVLCLNSFSGIEVNCP